MKAETTRDKKQVTRERKVSLGVRLLAVVVSPIVFLMLFELILTLLGYGLFSRFSPRDTL